MSDGFFLHRFVPHYIAVRFISFHIVILQQQQHTTISQDRFLYLKHPRVMVAETNDEHTFFSSKSLHHLIQTRSLVQMQAQPSSFVEALANGKVDMSPRISCGYFVLMNPIHSTWVQETSILI